jgi:hypothetical protein
LGTRPEGPRGGPQGDADPPIGKARLTGFLRQSRAAMVAHPLVPIRPESAQSPLMLPSSSVVPAARARLLTDQWFSVSCVQEIAHLLGLGVRHEACLAQTVRQEFGARHRVRHASLGAGQVLHRRGTNANPPSSKRLQETPVVLHRDTLQLGVQPIASYEPASSVRDGIQPSAGPSEGKRQTSRRDCHAGARGPRA